MFLSRTGWFDGVYPQTDPLMRPPRRDRECVSDSKYARGSGGSRAGSHAGRHPLFQSASVRVRAGCTAVHRTASAPAPIHSPERTCAWRVLHRDKTGGRSRARRDCFVVPPAAGLLAMTGFLAERVLNRDKALQEACHPERSERSGRGRRTGSTVSPSQIPQSLRSLWMTTRAGTSPAPPSKFGPSCGAGRRGRSQTVVARTMWLPVSPDEPPLPAK